MLYAVYDLQYYLNPTIYADSFLFDRSSSLAMGGLSGTYDYGTMVTVLNNGLLMLGVSSTLVQAIRGIVFIILVCASQARPKGLPSKEG